MDHIRIRHWLIQICRCNKMPKCLFVSKSLKTYEYFQQVILFDFYYSDRGIYVALFAESFICHSNVFDTEFDVDKHRIKFGSLQWNYGKMRLERHITSQSLYQVLYTWCLCSVTPNTATRTFLTWYELTKVHVLPRQTWTFYFELNIFSWKCHTLIQFEPPKWKNPDNL